MMRGYRFVKSSTQAIHYVYGNLLDALKHGAGAHLIVLETLWKEPQEITSGRFEVSTKNDPTEMFNGNVEKLLHSFVLSLQSDRFEGGVSNDEINYYLATYSDWINGYANLTDLIQALAKALNVKNKTAWDIFSQDIHMQAQVLISAEVTTYVTAAYGKSEYYIAPEMQHGRFISTPSYDFKQARMDVEARLCHRLENIIDKVTL